MLLPTVSKPPCFVSPCTAHPAMLACDTSCAVAFLRPAEPVLARSDSNAGAKKKTLVRRHSSGDHVFLPTRGETAAKKLAGRGGIQHGHVADSEVSAAPPSKTLESPPSEHTPHFRYYISLGRDSRCRMCTRRLWRRSESSRCCRRQERCYAARMCMCTQVRPGRVCCALVGTCRW